MENLTFLTTDLTVYLLSRHSFCLSIVIGLRLFFTTFDCLTKLFTYIFFQIVCLYPFFCTLTPKTSTVYSYCIQLISSCGARKQDVQIKFIFTLFNVFIASIFFNCLKKTITCRIDKSICTIVILRTVIFILLYGFTPLSVL